MDHRELATSKLIFKQPMTKVYCQIDAFSAFNDELVSVLFNVHRHELVANFWSMLGSVRQTKLHRFHLLFNVRSAVKIDFFTLDAFRPSNLVQTLSEKDDKSQYCFVIGRVSLE